MGSRRCPTPWPRVKWMHLWTQSRWASRTHFLSDSPPNPLKSWRAATLTSSTATKPLTIATLNPNIWSHLTKAPRSSKYQGTPAKRSSRSTARRWRTSPAPSTISSSWNQMRRVTWEMDRTSKPCSRRRLRVRQIIAVAMLANSPTSTSQRGLRKIRQILRNTYQWTMASGSRSKMTISTSSSKFPERARYSPTASQLMKQKMAPTQTRSKRYQSSKPRCTIHPLYPPKK